MFSVESADSKENRETAIKEKYNRRRSEISGAPAITIILQFHKCGQTVSTLISEELPLLPLGAPPVMTMVSPFFTSPLLRAASFAK